jgi:uncharacterized membrane protein
MSVGKKVQLEQEPLDMARIAAFSDGVFSVAITLMVLSLAVPVFRAGNPLTGQLRSQLPAYGVFFVSFLLVGVKWLNHNRLFAQIHRVDSLIACLNLLLLAGVTAVPFVTVLLVSRLHTPDATTAGEVYGLLGVINGLIYTAVAWYARMKGFLDDRSPHMVELYLVRPFGYLLGMWICTRSLMGALIVYALMASMYAWPQHKRGAGVEGAE